MLEVVKPGLETTVQDWPGRRLLGAGISRFRAHGRLQDSPGRQCAGRSNASLLGPRSGAGMPWSPSAAPPCRPWTGRAFSVRARLMGFARLGARAYGRRRRQHPAGAGLARHLPPGRIRRHGSRDRACRSVPAASRPARARGRRPPLSGEPPWRRCPADDLDRRRRPPGSPTGPCRSNRGFRLDGPASFAPAPSMASIPPTSSTTGRRSLPDADRLVNRPGRARARASRRCPRRRSGSAGEGHLPLPRRLRGRGAPQAPRHLRLCAPSIEAWPRRVGHGSAVARSA